MYIYMYKYNCQATEGLGDDITGTAGLPSENNMVGSEEPCHSSASSPGVRVAPGKAESSRRTQLVRHPQDGCTGTEKKLRFGAQDLR